MGHFEILVGHGGAATLLQLSDYLSVYIRTNSQWLSNFARVISQIQYSGPEN